MDQHPDFETLLAFREHRLSGFVVGEVALHVGQCEHCTRLEASAGRTLLEALVSLKEEDAKRPPQRWLIAAAAVFAVLVLSLVAVLIRRDTTTAGVRASGPPTGGGRDVRAPHVVASLADGNGRIALLEDGTVTGVQPRDAEDARAVLSGRSIAIPTFIAAMPGAVRGEAEPTHPLRAVEPFRSAVLESRPRFSWTPVRGARSYRVAVFDANYEEVASSESLTRTSWMPAKPLPAGVDLSWHIVAETDAGEISSAGSNRAEAVFRVLTPKEANEVKGLDPGSHLLRGLRYARHGLLHDAEREYRVLAGQNPGSPIARALIRSVSR